jgi:hypothetical protein
MNPGWRHTDPYPTNPFERVDGKELERLHRLLQKTQPQPNQPVFEEALL